MVRFESAVNAAIHLPLPAVTSPLSHCTLWALKSPQMIVCSTLLYLIICLNDLLLFIFIYCEISPWVIYILMICNSLFPVFINSKLIYIDELLFAIGVMGIIIVFRMELFKYMDNPPQAFSSMLEIARVVAVHSLHCFRVCR
jgi:hypothetical protein